MQRLVHESASKGLDDGETEAGETEPWFRVLQRWYGEYPGQSEEVSRSPDVERDPDMSSAGNRNSFRGNDHVRTTYSQMV